MTQVLANTIEQALSATSHLMDHGTEEATPIRSESVLPEEHFLPSRPETLIEAGLTESELESLVLKFLLNRGTSMGRAIADGIHLPLHIVTEGLERMRAELLVALKASAGVGDFIYELTEAGFTRATRHAQTCKYVGPAPVPFEQYADSVCRQSLRRTKLELLPLCKAFSDLLLQPAMLSQLGQALNAGRGLFLYGPPGNGKTSIAERVTKAYGQHIWVPWVISVNGEMIRLFDPSNHKKVDDGQLELLKHDRRWVRIARPTIIVGGELTLEQLDIQFNDYTGISEAPVHMKANCGSFVVDDFGRQRVRSMDLLNRLIVPLEKSFDYLNLPSGRQVEVPVEQLLVFSTNLSPKDLVDEAFLRRIPYKIEIPDASETDFRELFKRQCSQMGFEFREGAIDYLLRKYYMPQKRPLRLCHPRDLLRQVKNLCEFHNSPLELTPENFDVAIRNYFTAM